MYKNSSKIKVLVFAFIHSYFGKILYYENKELQKARQSKALSATYFFSKTRNTKNKEKHFRVIKN